MYEEALGWLVISAPNVILNTSRGPMDLKVWKLSLNSKIPIQETVYSKH